MQFKNETDEVLYSTDPLARVTRRDIEQLVELAGANTRQRVRLCTHPDVNDSLHEMLIVHSRGAYIRPHRHQHKSESFHIIAGELDVVLLTAAGEIQQLIPLGDYASGKTFYYRLATPTLHTLVIRSHRVVFHETTNGPFVPGDTIFPEWAPEEDDLSATQAYQDQLARALDLFGSTEV